MIYILILTCLIIILLSFFVYNLYRQNEQLEKFINEVELEKQTLRTEAENYYLAFLNLFYQAQTDMDRIDKRGSFSSDDEVGFAFKIIHTAINNVVLKLQELKDQEEEQK